MKKKRDMKIIACSSGEEPDFRSGARVLLEACRRYFQDPEHEKEYQEWLQEREERGKIVDEKMLKYEPGSKMREILKRTREQRTVPRGKAKPDLVFGYRLEDAWCRLRHYVEVYEGNAPYVHYSIPVDSAGRKGDLLGESGEIGIGKETLEEIRCLLEDDRLYETAWLEEPYDVAVLDGVMQIFRIGNSGRSICAEGNNLEYCQDDVEHCPHTVLMIRTMEKIKEILVPLGIPEVCFRLDE